MYPRDVLLVEIVFILLQSNCPSETHFLPVNLPENNSEREGPALLANFADHGANLQEIGCPSFQIQSPRKQTKQRVQHLPARIPHQSPQLLKAFKGPATSAHDLHAAVSACHLLSAH